MLDDLHHSEGPLQGPNRSRNGDARRPLADREVPLGREGGTLSVAVHAWLDGELPESAVRKGDAARDVDFWKRITAEVERPQFISAPVDIESRIMAALPQSTPQLTTPWFQRELVLTPANLLLAAAVLVALTAAVTAALLR